MQKAFLFLVAALCLNNLQAQNTSDSLFYYQVTQAVVKSNAEALAKMVHNKVDITLPGESGIYSKNQAKFIIEAFFEKHKPMSFYIESESRVEKSSFFVGKMHTINRDYRICFLTKNIDKKIFIYQIRIEE